MRVYLELNETLPPESGLDPEFIRADVSGKTEPEVAAVQEQMEAVMTGKSYRIWKHECYHEEGGPCPDRVIIKEVNNEP